MVSAGKVIQPRRNAFLRFKYNMAFVKASLRKNITAMSCLVLLFFFLICSLKSTFHTATVPSSAHSETETASSAEQMMRSQSKSLAALQQVDLLFPKEVIETVKANAADSSLPDLQSLPVEDLNSASSAIDKLVEERQKPRPMAVTDPLATLGSSTADHLAILSKAKEEGEDQDTLKAMDKMLRPDPKDPSLPKRRAERIRRRAMRLQELLSKEGNSDADIQSAAERIKSKSKMGPAELAASLNKYSVWRRDDERASGDQMVRLIGDQVIMAKVYIAIAQQHGDSKMAKELKARLKESVKSVGEATTDAELAPNAVEKMRAMGQVLARARDVHYDGTSMVKKLRAMVHSAEEQNQALRQQSLFLSQLAAKTIPKGLFCLAMRLTVAYANMGEEEREFPGRSKLEDNDLFHYALFSDNVLAAAVVVNSTVHNAKDSEKHVFHVVTDRLNFGAMKAWFLLNPPLQASIEVQSVDDFKWLNASYCPVLRQLESASMKEYYFQAGKQAEEGAAAATANLKYRNPKYLSMLNHLRFYLPEVFPKLHKILFLDDDIVVQRDLGGLWEVNLQGMVNGAVETCGASFHRFDKYLNFSNPLIADNFDPQACGWAYGMNMFDLQQWRVKDITGIYHHWQELNEDRTLWKLGTLPPGLITFYNLTHPLNKSWHVLGLGYNPNLDMDELNRAAVVHYNGNLKPWLEIGMTKYKGYWTKYVRFDHPFLQQCNLSP